MCNTQSLIIRVDYGSLSIPLGMNSNFIEWKNDSLLLIEYYCSGKARYIALIKSDQL